MPGTIEAFEPDVGALPAAPLWLVAAAASIALFGSVCGIGGGLFAVPLLHYVLGFPLRRAVATALCLVLTTTVTATVVEAWHADSALDWPLAGLVAGGALGGAQLGYALAKRIPGRALRAVFTLVLFAAGARILIFDGRGEDVAVDAAIAFTPLALAAAFAIGVGGGVLGPLLGIGGGLLMVPALFLIMPELGYLGARATSMAAATVTSGRSLTLFVRDGLVDRRAGLLCACGAFFGAAAGVMLVHRPGWAAYARIGMGAVLILVASRFLFDALRARSSNGLG